MFRTKVTNLAILTGQNIHKRLFGHSGQSAVSENGPNGFLIPKNQWIGTKFKSLACSEPKLNIGPFSIILTGHKWTFGHSGQSEESGHDHNEFLMPTNLGIDTKIKSLTCSEPKLQIWPFDLILNGQNCHKWPFWLLRLI